MRQKVSWMLRGKSEFSDDVISGQSQMSFFGIAVFDEFGCKNRLGLIRGIGDW